MKALQWINEEHLYNGAFQTTLSVDQITDDSVMKAAKKAGIKAGSRFWVQVFEDNGNGAELDMLLTESQWRVYGSRAGIVRTEDSSENPRYTNERAYRVERMTEWLDTPAMAEKKAKERVANARYIIGESKWNPGKKAYDIVVDGEIAATVQDKDIATAIATGVHPLPEMAEAA